MPRLRKQAIAEMLATMPNPESTDTAQRCILQLQTRVAVQQKLIDDLSGAVTQLQRRMYTINHKLNQN